MLTPFEQSKRTCPAFGGKQENENIQYYKPFIVLAVFIFRTHELKPISLSMPNLKASTSLTVHYGLKYLVRPRLYSLLCITCEAQNKARSMDTQQRSAITPDHHFVRDSAALLRFLDWSFLSFHTARIIFSLRSQIDSRTRVRSILVQLACTKLCCRQRTEAL